MESQRIAEIRNQYGFIERFLKNADERPDHLALLFDQTGEKLTYGQLRSLMEHYKGVFERMGIRPGDRVALLTDGDKHFIAAFYALASIGAVSVFTNVNCTAHEMEERLSDCRPVSVVATLATAREFSRVLAGNGALRHLLLVDPKSEGRPDLPQSVTWLEDYTGKGSPLSPPSGDPLCTLQYTYKGLGYPLGVLHRYDEFAIMLEGWERLFPVKPEETSLSVLPLYPILGSTLLMMFPLNCGSTLVLASNIKLLMKTGIIAIFEKYQIKYTCTAPIIVDRMLKEALEKRPGEKFRLNPGLWLTCGGEFLPTDVADKVRDLIGVNILYGYGLTEATITNVMPAAEWDRIGGFGKAFTLDTEMRIVDAERRPLPPGQVGELAITSPLVSEGYLGKPEASRRFFDGRTVYTGDICFADRDGHIYFVDRALRITKISAQMVDLEEIDKVLRLYPGVTDAYTVNVGRDGANYMSSTVSVASPSTVTAEALQEHCRGYLSRFKIPKQIFVRSYLPG